MGQRPRPFIHSLAEPISLKSCRSIDVSSWAITLSLGSCRSIDVSSKSNHFVYWMTVAMGNNSPVAEGDCGTLLIYRGLCMDRQWWGSWMRAAIAILVIWESEITLGRVYCSKLQRHWSGGEGPWISLHFRYVKFISIADFKIQLMLL